MKKPETGFTIRKPAFVAIDFETANEKRNTVRGWYLTRSWGYDCARGDKTAVKWYTRAAERGAADAQFNLGK